jgi:hypothetical protein
MGEWQPIETAPKDGEEILAIELFDDKSSGVYCVVNWVNGAWRDHSDMGAAGLDPFEPNLWMPLPAPPNPAP